MCFNPKYYIPLYPNNVVVIKVTEEKTEPREATSIKIKPTIWKVAKIAAINEGKTVSEVVEEALQEWIEKHTTSRREAQRIAEKYSKTKE